MGSQESNNDKHKLVDDTIEQKRKTGAHIDYDPETAGLQTSHADRVLEQRANTDQNKGPER